MADVVLTRRLEQAGLDGDVEVVSAGTGHWHIGDPMDRRAAAVLTAHGYDASAHRAQQLDATWHEGCDLLLAMDADNYADVAEMDAAGTAEGRLRLFRDFDPRATAGGREVPDPYFGGEDGFDTVLAMIERTAGEIVRALQASPHFDRTGE
jgi:protein-tyrosine phosphatase